MEAYPMKGRLVLAMAAVGSLAVAGCSSSNSSSAAGGGSASATGASTKSCTASIGFEGPITGPVAPLGTEQLHFAQLAVAMDNAANKTKITLVQGDTQLQPAQATTVTQQFISNSKILAVVGPAGSQEVIAIGSPMAPIFQKAGIKVDHESVSQKLTDFSSLVAKVTPETSVVVLPWQVAANAQQFGRNLAQQHKKAVIFGTDGLFSPGTFTINGSYVSSFGPDITAIAADSAIAQAAKAKYGAFGTFGPPVFAATHVIDEA